MADKRVYTIKHRQTAVKFEVDSRYTPLESIGTGAYGVVCAAKDNRTGRKVAVKKITKAFEVITIAKRTYRELKILRHFRHDNIISILDVMEPPEDADSFQDVYVVLDLMESDLHNIIHSVQPLSNEHIRFFLYQIMRGLKYIHSGQVLHRDLKPSNLLINQNCELKIGDFGMARGLSSDADEHGSFMTEYVATRWYRAPELMLSLNEYTSAMDIWSAGCIFAEMLGRRLLFPGKNYVHQLQLILSVVGTPSQEYISNIGSEKVRTYLRSLPERKTVDLGVLFPQANKEALDLLGQMLQLDPKKRCTADQALNNTYLSQYHDSQDEPVCNPTFDFSFEKQLLTKEALKKAIFEEAKGYHKSRVPIPPANQVKDALIKKMMERKDRLVGIERVHESSQEKADLKEDPSKKKKDDRKRKDIIIHDKKKKPKLAGSIQVGPSSSNQSQADKNVLEHWNKLHNIGRMSMQTLQGKAEEADARLHQQEELIKNQVEELDKQQRQLYDQQWLIQEQAEQIRILLHQQKILIRECKASGITIPISTPDPSPIATPPSISKLSSSSSSSSSPGNAPRLSDRIDKPITSVTTTIVTTSSSSSSSASKLIPPTICPLPQRTQVESAPSLPPPPSNRPKLAPPLIANISSRSRASNSYPPPPSHPPPPSRPPSSQPQAMSYQPSLTPPPQPASLQHSFGYSTHPVQPVPNRSPGYGPPPPLYPSTLPPNTGMGPPPGMAGYNTGMPPDFFAPLTSQDLMELTSKEVQKLSPFEPNSVGGFDPPLLEDLDNLFSLPMGCGAGYGVGVSEDELTVAIPPPSAVIDGPPSARLLEEWLDMGQMDPNAADALQQDLEFGASDIFFHDFELDKL